MSDGHDKDSHGGGKSDSAKKPVTDNFFQKVEDYITGAISTFVAAVFFLISLGVVYGFLVSRANPDIQPILYAAPLLAGIIAYYNRAFAIWIFIIGLILVLL